jgi:hypothetical protein
MVKFKPKYTVVFHWHDETVEVVGKFAFLCDAETFAQDAVQRYHTVSARILNKQGECLAMFQGKQR